MDINTAREIRERFTEERLLGALQGSGIPDYMHEGLVAYIRDGRPQGHFLIAVLSNDLAEAVNRADERNFNQLACYVKFLYAYAPRAAWGSPERVESYMRAFQALRSEQ